MYSKPFVTVKTLEYRLRHRHRISSLFSANATVCLIIFPIISVAPSTQWVRGQGNRNSTVSVFCHSISSTKKWVKNKCSKMDTCLCVEVYLILWFWFFSLLVVTGAQLVVRVTTLTIPPLRLGLLILRSRSYNSADIATIRSTLPLFIKWYESQKIL